MKLETWDLSEERGGRVSKVCVERYHYELVWLFLAEFHLYKSRLDVYIFSFHQVKHGVGNFLHEIGKAKVLNKEEEVLLATHVQEHSRIARACQYFREQEGRDPTDLELCNLFGMVSLATRI